MGQISYINGARLQRALIAGSAWVVAAQEQLNRINVFPVADGDTGTNMAATLKSVAAGARRMKATATVGEMSKAAAQAALMGARGNSGVILAQFFQGLSEGVGDALRLTSLAFAKAARRASACAYESLSEPKEGTILTVIRAWAEHVESIAERTHDVADLLRSGLVAAQAALNRTPDQLAQLKAAGVVDAGAQGFVHLLEGVVRYIESGDLDATIADADDAIETADDGHDHPTGELDEPTYRYCTECYIEGTAIDRAGLRRELEALACDSLIVAGSPTTVRIHIHTDRPDHVVRIAAKHGATTQEKADDMKRQVAAVKDAARVKRVTILTDSAVSLPPGYADANAVQIVPLRISFGPETFIDGVTLSADQFYDKLVESPHHPTTSQPTPADFKRAFELLADQGTGVVSVNLSGALSGTVGSARNGAKLADKKGKRVEVIDGASCTVGQGLLVMEAVAAARRGLDAAEVAQAVTDARSRLQFFVYFDTMEYLVKGGRGSKFRGLMARVLNLRPLLTLDETGKPVVFSKTMGGPTALKKLMRHVRAAAEGKRGLRVAIAHANVPEQAARCADQLREWFDVAPVMIEPVSPVLGVHAGPGAVCIAFLHD